MADKSYSFMELVDDKQLQSEIKQEKKKKFNEKNPPEKKAKFKEKLKAHLVMERRKKMGAKKLTDSKFYGYQGYTKKENSNGYK
jgi:hypothetical protein|tara:strand:- start:474 stop:725 length:252 start_codon:yes stop_codon:yes gene_type:complete